MSLDRRRLRVGTSLLAAAGILMVGSVVGLPAASAAPTAGDTGLVISQIYAAGGNTGATYDHDFIEVMNAGLVGVNTAGEAVQYRPMGSGWTGIVDLPATTIDPGQYVLISEGAGSAAAGAALPTADVIGGTDLSESAGVVAIVNNTNVLNDLCPLGADSEAPHVVDLVAWGVSGTADPGCMRGTGLASSTNSDGSEALVRGTSGCTNSGSNDADFSKLAPDPHTLASTANVCDDAPALNAIGNKSVLAGSSLDFTVSATDADNADGELTYSAANLPAGATFTAATRSFHWTPGNSAAGSHPNVEFDVTDGTLSDSEDITITVTATNHAPTISAPSKVSVVATLAHKVKVTGADVDGDALSFTATKLPKGATFNHTTHVLTWAPTAAQVGKHSITLADSDGELSAHTVTTITVLPAFALGKVSPTHSGIASVAALPVVSGTFTFTGKGLATQRVSCTSFQACSVSVVATGRAANTLKHKHHLAVTGTLSFKAKGGKSQTRKTISVHLLD